MRHRPWDPDIDGLNLMTLILGEVQQTQWDLGIAWCSKLVVDIVEKDNHDFQESIYVEMWFNFLSRKAYDGWTCCSLDFWFGSLQEVLYKEIMQCSGGCHSYLAFIKFIWDPIILLSFFNWEKHTFLVAEVEESLIWEMVIFRVA